MSDWKKQHANDSEKAVFHDLTQRAIEEFLFNTVQNPMNHAEESDEARYRMALNKVATHAAQVARAQALGFDPELLRLSPEEAGAHMWRMAAEAVGRGVPVYRIEAE